MKKAALMIKNNHPDLEKGETGLHKSYERLQVRYLLGKRSRRFGRPGVHFVLTHRRFGYGRLRLFGGMPVNRHSEAYDVIELLTKLKKFCPVENQHEMGRENQESLGAGPQSISAPRMVIL